MNEGFDFPTQEQQALARGYVAQLAGKRQAIQFLWERVQARPDDRSALADLHLQVHRLAGSAGPYGLPALGAAAQAVDRQLAPVARSEPASVEGIAQALATCAPLVTALFRAMETAK